MSKATLHLKSTATFKAEVMLKVKNVMSGFLTITYPVMSPDEFNAFLEEDLAADQQYERIVIGVEGLPDADTGEVLEGEAAIEAARNGKFAMWIRPAIVGHFIEQYGAARVKNSTQSRAR